jgi:elongation factor P
MVLAIDNRLYRRMDYQKVHPGKGPAYIKTELKNLDSGGTVRKRFRSGESVNEVTLIRRNVQYSYSEGDVYYFMDAETYEMIPVSRGKIGEDQLRFLTENAACEALTRDDEILTVELPRFVELEVEDTRPGVKGDTAQGGSKPATLASGAEIQVPLFIEEGDVIKVDREEDKYLERVSS